MRSKAGIQFAVIVAALLAIGVAWWWVERGRSRVLPIGEPAADAAGARPEPRSDSPFEHSAGLPAAKKSGLTQVSPASVGAAESGVPGSDDTRSESSRTADVVDDIDAEPESHGFERFKQLSSELRRNSQQTQAGDPLDLNAAELNQKDVDRLDLDDNFAISEWELERVRGLVARAERHPTMNDSKDGKYPVAREDYRRPESEFDAIDTNRDQSMDIDEYYAFVFNAEQISVALDRDGDRSLSQGESGLFVDDFVRLDFNDSGSLEAGEIRRAVAAGDLR